LNQTKEFGIQMKTVKQQTTTLALRYLVQILKDWAIYLSQPTPVNRFKIVGKS
jgi:hypothetical protein